MLLDTCIAIDVLRGSAAAAQFISTLDTRPSFSVITATELVAGCKNVKERRHIDQILSASGILDISLDVAVKAGNILKAYAKSHQLDPVDALIAATADHHGLLLVTHNLKHFPMFPGCKRPY